MGTGSRVDMPVYRWGPDGGPEAVKRFLRRPAFDARAERVAERILGSVRREGDRAVARAAREFDGARLSPGAFGVSVRELQEARRAVDAEFRLAVREARSRIVEFARAGMRPDWEIRMRRGGRAGERWTALDRVGAYVPGGSAPLVSTALMTVTLARVAGVREIVACTPCGPSGTVNPFMLYALEQAGATEVYRVGGVQAVGMMAYGTRTVRRVDKIVGPGGTFVTAAKRQVYGEVALDLVAGPSEIAVLADDSAHPRHVAADLLSQAEHGTGWEKALLVTTSPALAASTREALRAWVAGRIRNRSVRAVLRRGLMLVVTESMDDGIALCNRFAPEHLELIVRNPRRWLKRVRHAGAVFLGPWTPESVGDFVAGPSHVLPTGGAAARFSGLAVDDFRKRSSVVQYSKADLRRVWPAIRAFGRVEGLEAHSLSARVRLEKA